MHILAAASGAVENKGQLLKIDLRSASSNCFNSGGITWPRSAIAVGEFCMMR